MSEVSTIGLDLAKHVFQAHGADASGKVVFRKRAAAREGSGILRWQARLCGGDGGLQQRPSLGYVSLVDWAIPSA